MGNSGQSKPAAAAFDLSFVMAQLRECAQASELFSHPKQEFVVLLNTGAFCPPHRGHASMMAAAVSHLGEHRPNVHVLGGLMTPTHQRYVDKKCADKHCTSLRGSDRLYMLQMTIANEPSLHCGRNFYACPYELELPQPVEFWHVSLALKEALIREIAFYQGEHKDWIQSQVDRIRVYYVCGMDHAKKCNLLEPGAFSMFERKWTDALVVVGRTVADVDRDQLTSTNPDYVHLVHSPAETDVASTLIREHMIDGTLDKVAHMLAPEVVSYISAKHLRIHKAP